MKGLIRKIFLFLLIFFSLFSLHAQEDFLDLKLALIGPGDELYFWWGHIGLVVEDFSGQSWFFDWGVFDFHAENFFTNFAMGRLYYYCAASPSRFNFEHLSGANRDIILYTLDLPIEKKIEIIRFAEDNILPENRTYNYHHFRDNCATRIRDIIDMAVDGQFSAAFGNAGGRFTLREHIRRHTWFNPFIDWLLNFLMGRNIDEPITVWEEMFLPSEIILRVLDFQYTDNEGRQRDLIKNMEIINLSVNRPIVIDESGPLWPAMLIFSTLLSLSLFFLFKFTAGKKWFRPVFGSFIISLGAFFGFVGSVLFFMSFFSDHDYTYNNINIIFINPLWFLAIPFGIRYGFTKIENKIQKSIALMRVLFSYVFLAAALALIVSFFPAHNQDNLTSIVLVMPISLVLTVIMSMLYWRRVRA